MGSDLHVGQVSPGHLDETDVVRQLIRCLGALEEQVVSLNRRSEAAQERLDLIVAELEADRLTMHELRDSVHQAARKGTFRRDRTRVLFLVHLIEAWDSYHDVFRAMEASTDFEPIVATIPRHFNGDAALGFEEEVHRGLESEGVAHIRLTPRDMDQALRLIKSIDPDLIFRQSQWDADIPEELGSDRLSFARTCLVPYETMNIVQNVPNEVTGNTAVDSPYHRQAWVVFCTNDLVLEMARRDGVRGGAQFRVAGHPKADRWRAATPTWPVASGESESRRRRVAWSAHHTIGTGWTDFGAFPFMAADMLTWARERPGIEFVFLPHPALIPYTRSPDCPLPGEVFDNWLATWESLPNTGISTSGGYVSVLAASDLLITDGLSVLVEYQLLERPIVFFEREGHRAFNEIGEFARRGAHTVRTVSEARHVSEPLLEGDGDPLAPIQRQNAQRLFGDPQSADRILSTLREMISAERGSDRARTGDRAGV